MIKILDFNNILEFARSFFASDEYTEDEKNEFYLLICEWYHSYR